MNNLKDIKIGVLTPEGLKEHPEMKLVNISENGYEIYKGDLIDKKYRIIVEMIDLCEVLGDEFVGKYQCIISCSPVRLSKKQKEKVISYSGNNSPTVYDIYKYGYYAVLEALEQDGNDFTEWLKNSLPRVKALFGFYMDRPQNRVGNTGWDFIKGKIGLGRD
jgi:hypothetical protein